MASNTDSRTTSSLSITLHKNTRFVLDMILTPSGLSEVPKGSYSQLIGTLLTNYIEGIFDTDIVTVVDFIRTNPEATIDDLKEAINARKAAATV